ncbi:serine/threonine protein kinase [Nocardiopsis exhalans]|uniref:non-specific serine/threonine protein kinase n=1 Tax=Nocardiopsis exhalans TaxID=163604 RepID=A0ABY5CZT7_9ACTN|nr:serine/threonine-protein kinase [Nocardiopsis exhalans]USY17077.1 serine/threonine protein kinase [Nocardiopsis exhalans]
MALPHRTLRERYELVSEVGRGGMGRVWRAHDAQLNRTVAVKEILLGPGMDEEERARVAARARREAQATAMGQHPNIVTVHDIVEDDGRPWIVMELLDGHSLLRLMRDRGPVPAERAAAWGLDLLDALTTAHEQGITHRDVKPENVMVTGSGRVVLTDFGIATIVDTAAVTQTAGVMGSAAYVAPERLASQPATPASDLWSLGATLYHAVTGVSPFQREGVPATLHAVLSLDPPQNLPGPLGAAISGMLVKDPLQRLDARGCRELLGAAARGEQTTGSHLPPTAPGRATTQTGAPLQTGELPPGATSPGPPLGPLVGATAVHTEPRRPRRLSWPVVVLTLGLSALLVAATLVIVNPWAEGGEETDQAGPQTQADTSSSPSPEHSPGSEATGQGSGEEPVAEGMTWTEDPEGFAMLIPDGWVRRVDGASVYYDSPSSNTYLQVDRTPHSTDDEYAHVLEQESNSLAENRLPGYQRIKLEDVTDQTSFASAADWEFSWDRGAGTWRLLARNIAVTAGDYYTLAWSSSEERWAGDARWRDHAIGSFDPL